MKLIECHANAGRGRTAVCLNYFLRIAIMLLKPDSHACIDPAMPGSRADYMGFSTLGSFIFRNGFLGPNSFTARSISRLGTDLSLSEFRSR